MSLIPLGIVAANRLFLTPILPPASSVTLTLTSPGDNAGIFNYIGTLGNTVSFVNPVMRGADMSKSTDGSGSEAFRLTDQSVTTNWQATDDHSAYVEWDFGEPCTMSISDYTICSRSDRATYLRGWTLEGKLALGDAYTPIDIHVDEDNWTSGVSVWKTFSPGDPSGYRFIRLRVTEQASDGNWYNGISEIEFYGTFATAEVAPPPGSIDLLDVTFGGLAEYLATNNGAGSWVVPTQNGNFEVIVGVQPSSVRERSSDLGNVQTRDLGRGLGGRPAFRFGDC